MDKQGKATGSGSVREHVVNRDGLVLIADLLNYNFDGNVLKEEHKQYLSTKIVPLLKETRTHAKMHGLASRKGESDYNRQLSIERVLRVKQFLINQGLSESQVPGQEMRASGEDVLPPNHGEDDERDRAVRITIALGRKTRPIRPRLRPFISRRMETLSRRNHTPRPVELNFHKLKAFSTEWMIKLEGAGDLSLFDFPKLGSAGVAGFMFRIVDKTNQEEVLCALPSGEVGVWGTPASITEPGPWKHFKTNNPQRIADFEGLASWNTIYSAAKWSKGFVVFRNVAGDLPFLAHEEWLETGWTHGAGILQTAQGYMICTEPEPFVGE